MKLFLYRPILTLSMRAFGPRNSAYAFLDHDRHTDIYIYKYISREISIEHPSVGLASLAQLPILGMGGGPDHKLHGPDHYSTINQFLGWEGGPDHKLHGPDHYSTINQFLGWEGVQTIHYSTITNPWDGRGVQTINNTVWTITVLLINSWDGRGVRTIHYSTITNPWDGRGSRP